MSRYRRSPAAGATFFFTVNTYRRKKLLIHPEVCAARSHQVRSCIHAIHDYIHYNPVRHGLVERVAQWPYSTFRRYAGAGIYPQDSGRRSW